MYCFHPFLHGTGNLPIFWQYREPPENTLGYREPPENTLGYREPPDWYRRSTHPLAPERKWRIKNSIFENSRTTIGKRLKIVGICSQYVVYSLFNIQETYFSCSHRFHFFGLLMTPIWAKYGVKSLKYSLPKLCTCVASINYR